MKVRNGVGPKAVSEREVGVENDAAAHGKRRSRRRRCGGVRYKGIVMGARGCDGVTGGQTSGLIA